MIDSLIATTDRVLAKHYKKPLLVADFAQRLEALHAAMGQATHQDRSRLQSDMFALLSCYVPDSVWEYCLQEAMKPLEGK